LSIGPAVIHSPNDVCENFEIQCWTHLISPLTYHHSLKIFFLFLTFMSKKENYSLLSVRGGERRESTLSSPVSPSGLGRKSCGCYFTQFSRRRSEHILCGIRGKEPYSNVIDMEPILGVTERYEIFLFFDEPVRPGSGFCNDKKRTNLDRDASRFDTGPFLGHFGRDHVKTDEA
jgi:hypothetical protein